MPHFESVVPDGIDKYSERMNLNLVSEIVFKGILLVEIRVLLYTHSSERAVAH